MATQARARSQSTLRALPLSARVEGARPATGVDAGSGPGGVGCGVGLDLGVAVGDGVSSVVPSNSGSCVGVGVTGGGVGEGGSAVGEGGSAVGEGGSAVGEGGSGVGEGSVVGVGDGWPTVTRAVSVRDGSMQVWSS